MSLDTPSRDIVPSEGNLALILTQLQSEPFASDALRAAAAQLHRVIDEGNEAQRFLTVIVRTQGNRLEPLKDALLCLAGQSVQDFDVVLVVHSEDEEAIAAVTSIHARLEPSFKDRVALEVVRGGARALPLNKGLESASGRYVSVFDDDDLLMGHWVESFLEASMQAPGTMLRAVSANQSIRPETWTNGAAGIRTLSWTQVEFPKHFVHIDHLLINRSPFMTWAFPRTLFFTLGKRFDEELAVCEDWDMILQGASLCGVTEVHELTSIYRRWQRGDSSYLVHHRSEWLDSENRVRDRLEASPLLLPPGSVSQVKDLLGRIDVMARYGLLFKGPHLRQPLDYLWVASQPLVNVALKTYLFGRRIKRKVAIVTKRLKRRLVH